MLRALTQAAIEQHMPAGQLDRLKEIETAERRTLEDFLGLAP